MSVKIVKLINTYINKNYSDDRMEIASYIKENYLKIVQENNLSADEEEKLSNEYCDNTSEIYNNILIPRLKEYCVEDNSRIVINEFEGAFYLELNEYARNMDYNMFSKYSQILDKLCESDSPEKGVIYENFCKKWLEFFCNDVKKTSVTNDKGIDLIGRINLESEFSCVVKQCYIDILVQVKMYSSKVDTPIIRAIIGDSLLMSFEEGPISVLHPTMLCVISHKGFTKAAKEYAKKYDILLLKSEDMLRIAAQKGYMGEQECFKYLDSYEEKRQ